MGSGRRVKNATLKRRVIHGVLLCVAIATFSGFIALGNWQLERRVWKLGLIERTSERVGAVAVAPPEPATWAQINRDEHEYLHLELHGRFLGGRDILVVAATELGSGYWVMTPFQTASRGSVLINRGFISQGVAPSPAPEGELRLRGLLRLSEPGGGVLRDNLPEDDRWYSRDVAAIAARLDRELAPFFVDAAADQPGSPGDDGATGNGPTGGLTVIRFHNSHLIYAITWYGLALMVLAGVYLVWREARRDQ